MKLFKNLKRYEWIIATAIFFGIIGSIVITGLFVWKLSRTIVVAQNDDGWLTYINEELGYSLKYPKNYIINQYGDNMYWSSDDNTSFGVSYRLDAMSNSLNQWMDSVSVGDIKLGDKLGKKFNYKHCDGLGCTAETLSYVVQHRGKLLSLYFTGDYELDSTEKAVLASFKFLADDNWSIYTNNDYFYSIQYPSDWHVDNFSNMTQFLTPDQEATGKYNADSAVSVTYVGKIDSSLADEEETIFVNNIRVIKQLYKNNYNPYTNLFFPRPEGGFIKIYWSESLENKYHNFWQIVSSIVVLDDGSLEWELYTNENLGISFNYPKLKWGKIKISDMNTEDHDVNIFKSGQAKIIKFDKYPYLTFTAFSDDFSHMYYFDPYLGDKKLNDMCKQEGILTNDGICRNLKVGGQDTYENIADSGYECSFSDTRQIRLNLNNNFPGLLIKQSLPSTQTCAGFTTYEEELEHNMLARTKDLTDQYNRKDLEELDLMNLELLDDVLSSFEFINL